MRQTATPRVLWVEDDVELVELYLLKLNADGLDVTTAGDGEEGLRRALELRPDLLVTDIRMPGTTGLEMIERLRSNPVTGSIPVVVLSNYDDPELQHHGTGELGVLEWLVKSNCTPGELSERIRFWSGQYAERAEEERRASGQ